MRSFKLSCLLCAALGCAGASSAPVQAAPWIFQRSPYSHPAPANLAVAPVDPRVYAGPYYTAPQGDYLRGSFRLSRSLINIRGRTVDQTWHWESWIQGGSQY